MSKVTTGLLAITLSVPIVGFAQSSAQQQDDKTTQQQQNQAAQTSQMGGNMQAKKTMSGMVGENGKTLTSNDKVYTVNNPNSLKAYDNQSVTVVFHFNTDSNSIHVMSVTPAQP